MSGDDSKLAAGASATEILWGLDRIASAANVESRDTAHRLIVDEGMPAARIGGRYVSTTGAIVDWFRAKAEGRAA